MILAFYPADWSPVCGDQLALYNEILPEFQKFNAALIGISAVLTSPPRCRRRADIPAIYRSRGRAFRWSDQAQGKLSVNLRGMSFYKVRNA